MLAFVENGRSLVEGHLKSLFVDYAHVVFVIQDPHKTVVEHDQRQVALHFEKPAYMIAASHQRTAEILENAVHAFIRSGVLFLH